MYVRSWVCVCEELGVCVYVRDVCVCMCEGHIRYRLKHVLCSG